MSLDEPRHLRDARTMRALAHPLRLRLLSLLRREGSLTATRASELLGESTGSTSFHLRQLAKYGFVVEDEGGRGRERPWRAAGAGTRWDAATDDPELAEAGEALASLVVEQDLEALRTWLDTQRDYPPEWRQAALVSDSLVYLTAEELAALNEELVAVLRRHRERTLDPALRPAGARPVSLLAFTFPLPPTATGN